MVPMSIEFTQWSWRCRSCVHGPTIGFCIGKFGFCSELAVDI